MKKSKCDNCGWVGVPLFELHEIGDLLQRIEPGGIVPSGECPKCDCLCYPVKQKPKYVAHAVRVGAGGDGWWTVKIPSGIKSSSKWFTVCDCYYNPMTGDAEETAIKIAQLLNGD